MDNVVTLIIIRNYLKIVRVFCAIRVIDKTQNTIHAPFGLAKIDASINILSHTKCLVNQATNGQDSPAAITAPSEEVSSHLAGLLSSLFVVYSPIYRNKGNA